jgi:hypothetical protein
MNYTLIVSALLALVLLILSSVSLGSANKIQADQPAAKVDVDNVRRSSQGLVVISVALVLAASWQLYGEYKPKQQSIYYF